VLGVQTDLTVESDVTNLFEEVNKAFGRPADVVIANAGLLSDLLPLAEEVVSKWWNVYVSWICD
jgi:NAD(P)-dependent dehydrogenase (short-subunit alcohol dehydrogenase family)